MRNNSDGGEDRCLEMLHSATNPRDDVRLRKGTRVLFTAAPRPQRPFYVSTVLALMTLLALLGSGPGTARADVTATPVADGTLALLTEASSRLADTPTVSFKLDVKGTTFIDGQNSIQLLEAQGQLERPDRVKASFKVKVLAPTLTINLITIADESWTTDLITGRWGPAPEEFSYDPRILFDNQNGIGPVMGKVIAPKREKDEKVGDRATIHITGTVDQTVIGPLTAGTMKGSPVAVDLWIDIETGDLLRVRLEEPTFAEKDDPATWTLDLYDQGDKVEIESPV